MEPGSPDRHTGTVTDLELGQQMADVADAITSRYFGSASLAVETKSDGSPVTAADREVEETLSRLLAEHRPDDGVLGEEVGGSGPRHRYWILDGVDGTHNFAAGRSEWGTLIAMVDEGEVTLGIVTSPALRRRWWAARGEGAWTAETSGEGGGLPGRLVCSSSDSLDDAVVPLMPPAEHCEGWRRKVAERLERGTVRPTAFGHSAVRVAAGEVDAAVHLAGGPWDIAAGVVIVEEAGGRFADLWGGRRLDTRSAVYTNSHLFDAVLTGAAADRPSSPT